MHVCQCDTLYRTGQSEGGDGDDGGGGGGSGSRRKEERRHAESEQQQQQPVVFSTSPEKGERGRIAVTRPFD